MSTKGQANTLYPFVSFEDDEIAISTIIVERNEIASENLSKIFLSIKKILRVIKCPIDSFLKGKMVIEDVSIDKVQQLNEEIGQFDIKRSQLYDETDSDQYDLDYVNGLYEIVNSYISKKAIETEEAFVNAYKFLFFDKYVELYRTVYPKTFSILKL